VTGFTTKHNVEASMALQAAQQLAPWLRGPVDGVPEILVPVAHALQQTQEELADFTDSFPDELLWDGVAGLASVGFHLRHIAGVVDRLFSYARGAALTDEQRQAHRNEGAAPEIPTTTAALVQLVDAVIDRAIDQLRDTDPATLTDVRLIGSKQLPSTVFGSLFHAAEHAQRHVGQLLVTTRVLQERDQTRP
jgi:uncharacterized damage-inducible protein DinB